MQDTLLFDHYIKLSRCLEYNGEISALTDGSATSKHRTTPI